MFGEATTGGLSLASPYFIIGICICDSNIVQFQQKIFNASKFVSFPFPGRVIVSTISWRKWAHHLTGIVSPLQWILDLRKL